MKCQVKSLSARRAWIEMLMDRWLAGLKGSLSARRAWIEMSCPLFFSCWVLASLSARRAWIEMRNAGILNVWAYRRSPQGERG